jgi:hypothetical protein
VSWARDLRDPLFLAVALLAALEATAARAVVVNVSTEAQLRTAIDNAQPGDVITLAAGTYVASSNLNCDNAGTADRSIVVRATSLGGAVVRFNAATVAPTEGFKVSAPYWTFENLVVEGTCAADDDCEHAFHVFGDAEWLVLRHNRLRDFNAQVKSNGFGNPFVFPDDVLIEGNELYDTHARNTGNPTTKLDIVGGRRWVVRANSIHDYEKGGGDGISYAAFLKGNSRQGLFERNLVICSSSGSSFTGGTRLGLSFGGGGTGTQFCEDATCPPEHQGGVMRNNIIMRCDDVGIYLNAATSTGIYANTLYDTAGIDVRFPESSADLRNNVLSGQIRNRDGGTSTEGSNVEFVTLGEWDAWFATPAAADFTLTNGTAIVDLGEVVAAVTDDYCGALRRSGAPDLGAVEYPAPAPCVTSIAGGGTDLFRDGFERGGVGAWIDKTL